MKENAWTKSICDLLQNQGLGENIYIDVLKKIPYALEISSFNEEWEADTESLDETVFETDMVVYEKVDEKIIPRVIVESKVGSVTTHDAITYSHKAMYHKNVIPFVRYGIMLGARETYPLPGRLFRHGTNFDFLFSFVDYVFVIILGEIVAMKADTANGLAVLFQTHGKGIGSGQHRANDLAAVLHARMGRPPCRWAYLGVAGVCI